LEPSTNPDRPDPVKPDTAERTPPAENVPPTVNGTPPAPAEGEQGAPPPPLTPMGWLAQNGIYLLLFVFFIGWLYRGWGMMGLVNAALALVAVSFVIFIHELGHFLAAKWCDVHVQTFSIGFGPAIPGCSFQYGETTYKIGVLPLGGYVAMVGEGPEADESEDYPRSFKNKSVAARMLIISAGVIMNVLLGAVCFMIVYNHGREVQTAGVWNVDPGSPAWSQGVQGGWTIKRIGTVDNPTFVDLKNAVMLSGYDEEIEFVFQKPDGETVTKKLKPRRDANDLVPVIGVSPPHRLRLLPELARRYRDLPVMVDSAAAAARAVGLRPGDTVKAATNPDKPDEKSAVANLNDLSNRMRRLVGKPLILEVLRKDGKVETIDVPVLGFDFGDNIISTSNPAEKDPFVVEKLPPDPSHPKDKTFHGDPYEFRRRMRKLAGKPAVIEVERADGDKVQLLVPPAFHQTLGLRMRMGRVAAVREDSPADRAGIKPVSESGGDVLTQVKMTFDDGKSQTWKDPSDRNFDPSTDKVLDPVRLPSDMAEAARAHKGKKMVTLHVGRLEEQQHGEPGTPLNPVEWDDSYDESSELPGTPASPMSIPQLGLAYYVRSLVDTVEEGSPADRAGIKKLAGPGETGDVIEQIRFTYRERDPHTGQMKETTGKWIDMKSIRGNKEGYDEWPYYFDALQGIEVPTIEVRVRRGDKLLDEPLKMTTVQDRSWPLEERGLILEPDTRLEKGDNLLQSLGLGVAETKRWLQNMYLQLRSLLTGRISTKGLGGPIAIASQAFTFAEDPYALIMWMGVLSINLAVLNFLPIPILDGGHMVFLIYEGIRGKPPSETVRTVAMYVGLALLLALMLFVTWQDIMRAFFTGR
jgi:regulator of sigma E protease